MKSINSSNQMVVAQPQIMSSKGVRNNEISDVEFTYVHVAKMHILFSKLSSGIEIYVSMDSLAVIK
ncbi:hypothetical protein EV677_1591 [Herminiimonas fonticola]|uniref:Uncharacterized protein n=1 Tax=Herminiimonas fonticola TaxID=303380 RepID=A0A4R6G729_9BURK|nr:hypothetical protein Hfont_2827 [Herminiimonas fonticola]TDN89534.1 hypothetical protein EV677_1591 [Herminiimonas fonticola]